jgi:hypothetical protein
MTTAPSASPRRNVQLAGRAFATLVFAACAVPMARNLLLEPRRSPFDVVFWSGGLAISVLLVVLGAAAVLERPIWGRTAAGDDRVRTAMMLIVLGMTSASATIGWLHQWWVPLTGGTATSLAIVFELWRDRRRLQTTAS